RAINLHVKDRSGRDLAVLPEVSLTLSAHAMARGLIAPSKVEILSPNLLLRRRADGVLMFGLQKLEQSEAMATAGLPDLSPERVLEERLNDADPNQPAGYLRSISIIDGNVTVDDHRAGMRWQATHVNFEVSRNEDSTLGGRLSADLPQFGAPALGTASMT